MEPQHADRIASAAADIGGDEVTARHEYNGRNMYRNTTSGVVGSLAGIFQAAAYAATMIEDESEKEQFLDDLGRIKTDNMGHDVIVY